MFTAAEKSLKWKMSSHQWNDIEMCTAVYAVAAIYLLYALFVHAAHIDKSIYVVTIIERPL